MQQSIAPTANEFPEKPVPLEVSVWQGTTEQACSLATLFMEKSDEPIGRPIELHHN